MPDPNIEVARDFYDRLGRLDFEGVGEHLADDVEATFPFLAKNRSASGKAEVLSKARRLVAAVAERIDFVFDAFHPGADPDLLVMQFHSTGIRVRSGGPYENEYVAILRFREGKITYWAEYFDPIRGAGGLDKLRAGA